MCHLECLKNALIGDASPTCGTALMEKFRPLRKKTARKIEAAAEIIAEIITDECEREAAWLYLTVYIFSAEKITVIDVDLWKRLNGILKIGAYFVAPLNYGCVANVLNFSYLAELLEILEPEPKPDSHNPKLIDKLFLADGLRWLEIVNYLYVIENVAQRNYMAMLLVNIMHEKYPERVPFLISMVSKNVDNEETIILIYKHYIRTLDHTIFRATMPAFDIALKSAEIIRELDHITPLDYILTIFAAVIDRPNFNQIISSNNSLQLAASVLFHCPSSTIAKLFAYSDEMRTKLNGANKSAVINDSNSFEITVMLIGDRITLPVSEMKAAFSEAAAMGDVIKLIPHYVQYLSKGNMPPGLMRKNVFNMFSFYKNLSSKLKLSFTKKTF